MSKHGRRPRSQTRGIARLVLAAFPLALVGCDARPAPVEPAPDEAPPLAITWEAEGAGLSAELRQALVQTVQEALIASDIEPDPTLRALEDLFRHMDRSHPTSSPGASANRSVSPADLAFPVRPARGEAAQGSKNESPPSSPAAAPTGDKREPASGTTRR